MTTALLLYNAALIEIGDRPLSTISDAVESQRIITAVYDAVLAECLEAGQWNFAMRTVQLDADGTITPEFGPKYVFAKPSDWLRTSALSTDENLRVGLVGYLDDVNYWSTDTTPIYVRYVSNSTDWGLNLANWPRSFTRYVELALADRIVERLSQNATKKEVLRRDLKDARRIALNRDAMNEAQPKRRPMGAWNSARGGVGGMNGTLRGGWPSTID